MRVAIGLHKENIKEAIKTYDFMSNKYLPMQLRCFILERTDSIIELLLLGIDDSIKGIYKCLSDCAQISKWAGGIGIHMSNIRAKIPLLDNKWYIKWYCSMIEDLMKLPGMWIVCSSKYYNIYNRRTKEIQY